MAKVKIVITDDEKADTINIKCEFDPPAKRDVPLTPAQNAAFNALQAMKSAEEDTPTDGLGDALAQLSQATSDLGDAGMMIRRLLHHVPEGKLKRQAADWLARKGLKGSILRS